MVPACRDGRMPENCVAAISTGRLRRLLISLARSTLKPSIPPESFGMAWGAKVPSTAVLSGCWAGAGQASSSTTEAIATPADRLRKRMTSLQMTLCGVGRCHYLAPFLNGRTTLDVAPSSTAMGEQSHKAEPQNKEGGWKHHSRAPIAMNTPKLPLAGRTQG